MHQSGHERTQSMQTVQLSSRSAMTPRDRIGGASFSCGYCDGDRAATHALGFHHLEHRAERDTETL